MDKKRKLVWGVFILSFIISIFGFLAYLEKYNVISFISGQREIWHILCFLLLGIFIFFSSLLILGENSKNFIYLTIILYILLVFIYLDWEIPFRAFSFLGKNYSNGHQHFLQGFLGLFFSIIINLGFYFNFLKK